VRLAVVSELPELPVPLAPMEVLPPVLGLAAVEPLLVLGGLAAVEPLLVLGGLAAVEPLLVLGGLAAVEPLLLVSAPVLCDGVAVLDEPLAAPAPPPPPAEGEAAPPAPLVVPGELAPAGAPPPLLEVWAMDSPPNARPTAAARVVRAFLVVVISYLLDGNPEGNRLKEADLSQLPSAYVSI
jgi:hypothetical protein